MTWVQFADKTSFVNYHDASCAARGIPKPGQIQKTGMDALGNQWTTAWVRPVMDNNTLKALVPRRGHTHLQAHGDNSPRNGHKAEWERVHRHEDLVRRGVRQATPPHLGWAARPREGLTCAS